jgi:hypothetical protein
MAQFIAMDTETPIMAKELNVRVNIWPTALLARLDMSGFLHFVATIGCSRPVAMFVLFHFRHFWQRPISSPVSEISFHVQCLRQVCSNFSDMRR